MWETASALSVVLGFIVLVAALVRGLGFANRNSGSRSMRIVDTISLGGRQKLYVVEVKGESLLIGSTDNSVNLLRELSETDEVELVEEDERPPQDIPWTDRLRDVARATFVFLLLYSLSPGSAAADILELGPAQLTLVLDDATTPARISSTLQIVALLTLISVAPSMILMMTCYARVLIVLTLLRQAMGTHQLPPRQVLVSLALFTTFYVMAPVGEEIYENALVPYTAEEIDVAEAATRAALPVREYLLSHTRQKDLALFYDLSDLEPPESREEVGFRMLLPAYLISEIRTAFEIGFMIYLPFLIIDILVASMLISMGMMVLPPMMISLPFKLMLFVLLDGWNLLIRALVTGLQ